MTGPIPALALALAALAQVRVTLDSRGEVSRPVTLTASPQVAGNGAPPAVAVEVSGSGTDLWLRGDVSWRLSCRGPAVWCPTVEVPAGAVAATVPIFPTAPWRARLLPPAGYRLPAEALLQGWIRTAEATLPCRQPVPVSPDGALTATLPAVVQDLRLAVTGFAPVYRWRLDPRRAGAKPEMLRLIPGGSLSGVVVEARTRLPAARASVRLAPASMDAANPEATPTDPASLFETTADARGFFQIAGLAPGGYRLRVGSADARGREVAIEANQEAYLPAVPLPVGLRLDVAVDPTLDPSGRPWRVGVESGSLSREAETQDGRASFPDLPAGFTRIDVHAEGMGRVGYREEDLGADREVAIDLGLVRVEGEVTLGDSPLRAHLRLMTGKGDEVELDSDEAGSFSGWMPEPRRGWIEARVASRSPRVQKTLRVHDVRVRGGRIELRLDLPDAGVSGTVVDENGKPVGNASVKIVPEDGSTGASSTTDASGRFATRGLLSARHTARALASNGRSSEKVAVDLTTGDVEGLRLVLLEGEEREGTLLSAEGIPVGGAEISVRPLGYLASGIRAVTEADGTFRFPARRGTSRLALVVQAPSQVLWSGCVAVEDGRRLVVTLPPRPGGELILRLNRAPPGPGDWFVVSGDGGSFGFGPWLSWELATGGAARSQFDGEEEYRFRLPRVAAGAYALVWAQDPEAVAGAACVGLGGQVEWKLLAPGGSLELRTPKATDSGSARHR